MDKKLYDFIVNREHHKYRKDYPEYANISEEYAKEGLLPEERMARRFELLSKLETPVILDGEKICFIRTVKNIPDCFTEEEWKEIKKEHHIHELGYLSNMSPDYEGAIADGLLKRREDADEYGKRIIDAIIDLSDRYREEARKQGREDIAKTLERVPRYGATNLREALQFFRIIHYSLWLEGNYHNTVGRFDKDIYPYFKADMENGVYTRESALELIEDFFLNFNKDSDMYVGVQQGDNGQSMVLGGIDENGNEVFSELSELCLIASKNLLMIDPKINIRVNKNTPMRIYELGSELTKAGLGFPQYSNDDVIIEGLLKLGYEIEDARNYAVAACWEMVVPKVGADVPNIGALSYPKVIDDCLHNDLENCETYEEFEACVKARIMKECDVICSSVNNLWFVPSPFMNVVYKTNVYEGGKYNNFGIHGTGIATAADSLAVIKKYVYDEKTISKQTLIEAVDSDFSVHSEILPILRNEAPKMGNNEELPDAAAVMLLDAFSDSLKGRTNCRGGKFRAGTGSAMFYLWHANEIGASPDGRRKGEPFGTNFSASLFAKINGPISVIKSFAKPHFTNAINGGPLTLEFASSMFTGDEAIKKIAALVKAYMDMGGHQLQLNAVNTELMHKAQEDPDKYRQLVVRIWGWSAYFVELDKDFQDHVIRRQQYTV